MLNLIYKKIVKYYILKKQLNLYFSNKNAYIYLKNRIGLIKLKLPSIFYYYKNLTLTKLSLFNNQNFKSLINNLFNSYKKLNLIYFIKLKIKGLGYRFRKLSTNFYYFFFNYTNMYYINLPKNIIIKWYKKRLILVSFDFNLIKLIMSTIIILKKLGPYQIRGLKYPKQIILLKQKKKNF